MSCRRRAPASARDAAPRSVVCADALVWMAAQPDLPCVVTSLPDITELQGPPLFISDLEAYRAFFRNTVALIVGKLRPGCAAVFYQTDTQRDGEYVAKSVLCALGASDAGGPPLWHKVALRQAVGAVRFGKLPGFTHLVAFASPRGGLQRAPTGAAGVPDVFERGSMAWSRAMGVDAAVWACRFLKADLGVAEVCDPFCGSGTVLAAANYLGLAATGVDISSKMARHALVLRLYRTTDGALVARRSTDTVPGSDAAPAAACDSEEEQPAPEAAAVPDDAAADAARTSSC